MGNYRIPLKGFDGVVARIVTSNDGGPIRRIINGRSRRPTGTFTSLKAGGRAMPHESVEGERYAMWIAETATSVRKMLAQPHRLEIKVSSRSEPLKYYPDLLLEMDEAAATRMAGRQHFSQAVFAAPGNRGGDWTKSVVLEIKTKSDRRMEDADYRLKLRLARKVYEGLGVVFAVVQAETDLLAPDPSAVKRIVMNRHVAIDSRDIEIATSRVEDGPVPLVDLAASLGSGHHGMSKAFALHVRRVISIDLTRPLTTLTAVHRIYRTWASRTPASPVWPIERFVEI
ncbi:MAG: hypothetical protein AB7I79_23285 [Rhizobiaceae bacterium]